MATPSRITRYDERPTVEPSMMPDFHFLDFVNILRRRGRFIIGFGLAGVTLVSLVALSIPPRYTATAQVLIEAQGLVGAQATFVEQSPDQASVLTAVTALGAHDLLQRALNDLPQDPDFKAAVTGLREPPNLGRFDPRRLESMLLPVSWLTATGVPGPLSIRVLRRHLDVFQDRGSHVVSVNVSSISAAEATAVVNKITQLYVAMQEEQKRAATDRALTWLGTRIPELQREDERLIASAQQYQQAHKLVDSRRAAVTDQQIEELNRQLVVAEADLASQQARLSSARTEGLRDSDISELHRRELALRQTEAEVRATYSDSHPKVQQVRRQLQEVRQQVSQELDRAISSLEGSVQIVLARVAAIRHRLATLESASTDTRLPILEREAASNRQLYETLLRRREELQQQRQSLSPGVNILSLAALPDRPSSPSALLFILPALVVSFICASLWAIVRERLDRTFRNEKDILENLGVPCIGFVPKLDRLGKTRPHEYMCDRPFDPYTEAIRSIAATLNLTAITHTPKIVLFSSSVPGEGKTTLAVSFASYVALLGKQTLLIDLDFRNPQILRELGGTLENGRKDAIHFGRPSTEMIRRHAHMKLDYLSIPRLPIDPMTAFVGGHLSRLLDALREKYDCVVIDSSPLLATTEARLLASMVDKVVFAVKWGSTPRNVVQNALNFLQSPSFADAPQPDLAGIVITQVDLKRHARYRYGDVGDVTMQYGKQYSQQN